jgi:hypothetical protein
MLGLSADRENLPKGCQNFSQESGMIGGHCISDRPLSAFVIAGSKTKRVHLLHGREGAGKCNATIMDRILNGFQNHLAIFRNRSVSHLGDPRSSWGRKHLREADQRMIRRSVNFSTKF